MTAPKKSIWIGGVSVVIVLVATPWLLRGRMQRLSQDDLDAARTLWRQAGVTDYDVDIEVSGAASGRYAVVVRGGQLKSITRDGEPASPAAGDQWTVEGLFRTIDREFQMVKDGARELNMAEGAQLIILGRFDATRGYPIDYVRQVTGSSQSVRIRVHGLEVRETREQESARAGKQKIRGEGE